MGKQYNPQSLTSAIANAMDKFSMAKGRSDLQLLQAMNAQMTSIGDICQDLLQDNMLKDGQIMKLTRENAELTAKLSKGESVGEKITPPTEADAKPKTK